MTSGEQEIAENIRDWLHEHGYPLEMKVAQAFRERGFSTTQSEFYVDPNTEKNREIDVVASIDVRVEGRLVRFQLIIECKRSTDKPWLIFTDPDIRLADPARVAQRAASAQGRKLLLEFADKVAFQELDIFRLPKRPGYSATQVFSSGKDVVFEALMSASKAADVITSGRDGGDSRRSKVCTFGFPVVVVDGRIFEAFLEDSGDIIIQEVGQGVLVWRNRIVDMPHTLVHIVRPGQLGVLAEGIIELAGLVEKHSDTVKRVMGAPK